MKMDELIEIESDPKILDFRFQHNNLPMWLYVRTKFWLDIWMRRYKTANPSVKKTMNAMRYIKRIQYLLKTIVKNPFLIGKCDILIIYPAIGVVKTSESYINRLSGWLHFSEFSNVIKYIEISHYFEFSKLKSVSYFDLFSIIPFRLSKITLTNSNDLKSIKHFIQFLSEKNRSININKSSYEEHLVNVSKILYYETKLFDLFFRRTTPKIMIINDSHSGAYANLIYNAKRNNIIVCDYQHGYIGSLHCDYNYSNIIVDNLKDYFPDYLLTYGEFWTKNINIPGKCIIIGNYWINKYNEKKRNSSKKKDKISVLICSSGLWPEKYTRMIKTLIEKVDLNKYQIIFRPHPREKYGFIERYRELTKLPIMIDTNEFVYETLIDTDILISYELSTVLYEALYLGVKVFVMESEYFKNIKDEISEIFFICKDIDDLLNKFDISMSPLVDINKIYDPNPLVNIESFFKSILYVRNNRDFFS